MSRHTDDHSAHGDRSNATTTGYDRVTRQNTAYRTEQKRIGVGAHGEPAVEEVAPDPVRDPRVALGALAEPAGEPRQASSRTCPRHGGHARRKAGSGARLPKPGQRKPVVRVPTEPRETSQSRGLRDGMTVRDTLVLYWTHRVERDALGQDTSLLRLSSLIRGRCCYRAGRPVFKHERPGVRVVAGVA